MRGTNPIAEPLLRAIEFASRPLVPIVVAALYVAAAIKSRARKKKARP